MNETILSQNWLQRGLVVFVRGVTSIGLHAKLFHRRNSNTCEQVLWCFTRRTPDPLACPVIWRPMWSKCNYLLSEMETDYITQAASAAIKKKIEKEELAVACF